MSTPPIKRPRMSTRITRLPSHLADYTNIPVFITSPKRKIPTGLQSESGSSDISDKSINSLIEAVDSTCCKSAEPKVTPTLPNNSPTSSSTICAPSSSPEPFSPSSSGSTDSVHSLIGPSFHPKRHTKENIQNLVQELEGIAGRTEFESSNEARRQSATGVAVPGPNAVQEIRGPKGFPEQNDVPYLDIVTGGPGSQASKPSQEPIPHQNKVLPKATITFPTLPEKANQRCRVQRYYKIKPVYHSSHMPRTTSMPLGKYFEVISEVEKQQALAPRIKSNQPTRAEEQTVTSKRRTGPCPSNCDHLKYLLPTYDAFHGVQSAEKTEADRVIASIIHGLKLAEKVTDEEKVQDDGEDEKMLTDLVPVNPNSKTYFNEVDEATEEFHESKLNPEGPSSETQYLVSEENLDDQYGPPVFLSSDVDIELINRNPGDPDIPPSFINLIDNYWF